MDYILILAIFIHINNQINYIINLLLNFLNFILNICINFLNLIFFLIKNKNFRIMIIYLIFIYQKTIVLDFNVM